MTTQGSLCLKSRGDTSKLKVESDFATKMLQNKIKRGGHWEGGTDVLFFYFIFF